MLGLVQEDEDKPAQFRIVCLSIYGILLRLRLGESAAAHIRIRASMLEGSSVLPESDGSQRKSIGSHTNPRLQQFGGRSDSGATKFIPGGP